VAYGILGDFIIKLEKGGEASEGKDSVRRCGRDVIVRKTLFPGGQTVGCQKLFDREVHELYNLRVVDIDNRDETGTCGQNCFFCIRRSPICVVYGWTRLVELNSKDVGELLYAKWANRYSKAVEETLCEFSLLVMDA
jgi:hypothetical protein